MRDLLLMTCGLAIGASAVVIWWAWRMRKLLRQIIDLNQRVETWILEMHAARDERCHV